MSRRTSGIVIVLLSLAMYAESQKPSLIGFSANLTDFNSAGNLNQAGFQHIAPGFSILYWKGLSKYLDFSIRYNGVFTDYSKQANSSSDYISEFEGSLHLHAIQDSRLISPFISAGIGIGEYGSKWAPYSPLGIGLQLNLNNESYVFLQGNYRASMDHASLDNNLFYSLGVAGRISDPKAPASPKPAPALPVALVTDRDGDGVADSLDACPDVAGLAQFNGCPDTDGDGIPDNKDKCPTVKGFSKYEGCPIPDTDGDGINDEEDKCPTVKGVVKYNGCPVPDTDGDGVNDEEDKCPTVPGEASNGGCPVIKAEVKKMIDHAAAHLYFVTGRYALLKKSFKSLDTVASLMKADPNVRLSVNGYTDNKGKATSNQILSEKRAESVKKYLESKGINPARIQAKGFGILQPVANNNTSTGRAKNRRVEFKLNY